MPSGRIALPPYLSPAAQGAVRSLPWLRHGCSMIGCNDHGRPPLAPGRKSEPLLDLPDFYLDLMFGDLPEADRPTDDLHRAEEILQNVA